VLSGYKHREIAKFLNLPLGTVLWKYNRALKVLKENLKEQK
jgi:RNA polymerase sigma-70 factor (ECF subfamily)